MERVSGRHAIADGRFDPLIALFQIEISQVSLTRLISASTYKMVQIYYFNYKRQIIYLKSGFKLFIKLFLSTNNRIFTSKVPNLILVTNG